ncbi:MAG TPA: YncE family protein [Gemmatimonadales bacterium]|nr:YncE family protein [Gemmatimonadales bacterium]
MLQSALPNLSDNGRALLSALGCLNGHPHGSQAFAEFLGFHDRYQLARALRREGLPSLEVMGGWARTLYWMSEAEITGKSLRELAEREHVDPAIAYRLVRRVTGRRWSEVQRDGLAVTMLRFRDCCGKDARRHAGGRPTPPPILFAGPKSAVPSVVPANSARPRVASPAPGHRVIQSISERVMVDGWPFDVAFSAAGEAIVTRPHAAALEVLALNPLRATRTIRVGPVPTRVIPTPNVGPAPKSHIAYVTTQFAEAVAIVDLDTREQIGSIPVPGHALGAVLAPGGNMLYVTTNQDRLVAISTVQRAVTGSAAIPWGSPQLTMHPTGRWVIAPCWRAGVIVEVDAATLAITRRFEVGGIVQDVVVSRDGQSLYAANEGGWLDVVHLPTGRRTATIDLGTPALGLALTPDHEHLFIGLLSAGRVVVMQRQGLIERAVIVTGGRPRLIAPHPSGELVLVANEAGWVDLLR